MSRDRKSLKSRVHIGLSNLGRMGKMFHKEGGGGAGFEAPHMGTRVKKKAFIGGGGKVGGGGGGKKK